MFDARTIAKRVREERILRLWSQKDLSEKAYVHLNTIYRIETARVIPHLLTQQRLATAFGIKRAELFGD